MKRKHWTLTPWFIIFGLVMLFMATLMASYNLVLFYVELGVSALAFGVVIALSLQFRAYIRLTVRGAAEHFTGLDTEYLEKYKYPVAVSGKEGDIVWCNARFRKNLCGGRSPEGDSINGYLPGFSVTDIMDGEHARRRGRRGLPFYREYRLQAGGARISRQYAGGRTRQL